MTDSFDLERFVKAQDLGSTYHHAVLELREGRKTSHWMWFVFPQVAGLGSSPMSRRYAVTGLEEARAYLRHQVLGPRLLEVATIVTEQPGSDAVRIFGTIDAQKLRSCMTLFHRAAPQEPIFETVLGLLFGGNHDAATDRLLDRGSPVSG